MKKATSLQGSLSCENESNPIAKLDQFNALPLSFGSVFKSRHSVTQARKPWFFCALPKDIIFGRGGISSIQKRLAVKTYAPFYGGFEHPDCLQKQSIQKTIGAHTHA